MLPDPVYFENYADGAAGKNRNTVYWGSIDGVQMDFSKMDHRLMAYKWYIDQIRERFAQEDYKYIQLWMVLDQMILLCNHNQLDYIL